ncbi:MAG: cell division protein SepF [Acidimicrobiales bacterium]|jgi:cell division inhibitor SepF|nr:cell division protein SepF [Actinomycetota bacterium]MDA8184683.1 cell division protein SepF [Actinomycetota bacterium]
MAQGFMKRTMAYLGLVEDDEYEEYDDYEARSPRAARPASYQSPPAEPEESQASQVGGSIRTLQREREEATQGAPSTSSRPAVVRPLPSDAAARVHVVAPTEFVDAKQIADRVMASQPVIINLQVGGAELRRRMIDFCSGVAYALNGKMERVADKVYLITPSNVRVSAEERQRLQQNGLMRS